MSTTSFAGGLSNPAYVRDLYDDGDEDAVDFHRHQEEGEERDPPHEPTATETALPWKRSNVEEDVCPAPIKQREFPAWLKNEDYIGTRS